MQVRDVMRRNPRFTRPGASLAEAGRLMEKVGCGVLPVVGEGEEERVVGVITDRDVCLAVAARDRRPSEVTVREVISGELHSCHPGDSLRDALVAMSDCRVRRLPVVEHGGRLVGILSLDDVAVAAHGRGAGEAEEPTDAEVVATLRAVADRQRRPVAS
jgi:CBS domain-containing protein